MKYSPIFGWRGKPLTVSWTNVYIDGIEVVIFLMTWWDKGIYCINSNPRRTGQSTKHTKVVIVFKVLLRARKKLESQLVTWASSFCILLAQGHFLFVLVCLRMNCLNSYLFTVKSPGISAMSPKIFSQLAQNAELCYAMLRYVTLRYVMLCDVMLQKPH